MTMAVLMIVAVVVVVLVVREPPHAYSDVTTAVAGEVEPRVLAEVEEQPRREPGVWQALRAVLTQPDRSLALIFLAILCWSIGFNAVEAFFTLYGQNVLEIPVNEASRMLTFFAAAGVIFAIPAGLLGARVGRRRMVIACLLLLTVLFASAYFVTNVAYVQVMLLIAGAAWTAIIVQALPMVLDAAPSDDPGSYTGQYYIWGSLAAVIGPPLAGAVIELTGNNYRSIFIIAPVFMLLALLAMLRVRRGEASQSSARTEQAPSAL
jgi:maltose/moltooligosaccharide transporter